MKLFAFQQRATAEALQRFVALGHVNPVGEANQDPLLPILPATRIWMAIIQTEITAAGGGDISMAVGDKYEVGVGVAHLLALTSEGDALEPFSELQAPPDRTWITRVVYSHYPFAIPADDSVVVPVVQDRRGDYWVLYTPGLKQNCWATFDADFTTGNATVDGTIRNQWGSGVDHTVTDIVLYNHPTDVAGTYIFSGSTGGYCTAQWRGVSNLWNIIIPQCP